MLHYAITDRVRSASETWSQEQALLRQAGRLAQTGIDYVQLREKDLDAGALASLARRLVAILRVAANPPKLLLNSRADAAVAAGADGVHLSASVGSLTPADVRKLYAATGLPEPIVSISCHTLKEVQAARAAGATLILFGPIFEKVVSTHDGGNLYGEACVAEGVGLDVLRLACGAASPTPVLALGGVTAENTPFVLEAGAAGIAAIRLFVQ